MNNNKIKFSKNARTRNDINNMSQLDHLVIGASDSTESQDSNLNVLNNYTQEKITYADEQRDSKQNDNRIKFSKNVINKNNNLDTTFIGALDSTESQGSLNVLNDDDTQENSNTFNSKGKEIKCPELSYSLMDIQSMKDIEHSIDSYKTANGLDDAKVRSNNKNIASVGFSVSGSINKAILNSNVGFINEMDINKLPANVNAQIRSIKDASVNKYESRSMSWLKFNSRVLELAKSQTVPLFERLKYLSITESNLDEFNMVKLPNLLSGKNENNKTPKGVVDYKEYKMVKSEMNHFIKEQRDVHMTLLSELDKEGFELVVDKNQLTKKEFGWASLYFEDKVRPMLSPIIYDNMRPFQLLRNNYKYIGVIIRGETKELFGTVEVPNVCDRLIEIGTVKGAKRKFILIENLIEMNLSELFMDIKLVKKATSIFRVLKSTTYEVENSDEIAFKVVERKLKRNEHGDVMRIDICGDKNNKVREELKKLVMNENTIYNKVDGIVDLGYNMEFMNVSLDTDEKSKYKYSELNPKVADHLDNTNLFDIIKEEDIVLHHPYEPYQTVIDFINQAADDEDTVCIKQTLYRVSKDSPVVAALIRAARRGVMVTVICEIKARFDEMHNIEMAREIEKAGGQVIYGVHNRKIHAKMCLVVKRNNKGNLKSYVHVGTGNYNEKTSKIYTDISYFTSKKHIVNDIAKVFNSITGCMELKLDKVFCSPNGIVEHLSSKIDNEIVNAKNGIEAHIKIKVNGLTDKTIIDKLYEASEAGVQVTLIVRGMCSLVDTSKIIVKSIVGRLLEHSRIYEFCNAGDNIVYISSADLMERNLYNRVELLIPISGKSKKRVLNILDKYVKDESAFCLIDGDYKRQTEKEYHLSINKDTEADVFQLKKMDKDTYKKYKVRLYSAQEYFLSKILVKAKVKTNTFKDM